MTLPILSVHNLQVEFVTRRGTLRAIDGVSFDIAKGEVLGVVGESGAGKSVTGLAAIGLIDPPGRISGGEIQLSGLRIDNLPAEEMRRIRGKRIGMIFQDPLTSLNPLYTIAQQLTETILTHMPVSKAEARQRYELQQVYEFLSNMPVNKAYAGQTFDILFGRKAFAYGADRRVFYSAGYLATLAGADDSYIARVREGISGTVRARYIVL